jgi:heptose I phosphotransferase
MNHGSLWDRLARGVHWTWINERYRDALPHDLAENAMAIESRDRYHAKQGRATARVVFHPEYAGSPRETSLSVYLKRHFALPWPARLAALINPGGGHTPGSAEWRHLERARSLGIPVPEVVAAGERIGPWGKLQSFLMVADLTGCRALNEVMGELRDRLDPHAFARLKRLIAIEMARIASELHRARVFHKDLYLCHFFLDLDRLEQAPSGVRLVLIDLHRLKEHKFWPDRWRWKDLGQLLFSTTGVPGIGARDRLRFWKHYRRGVGLRFPGWQAWMVTLKAARYLAHNQGAEAR